MNIMENRNIKEEMKSVSGGEFKNWYDSLTTEEKMEYDYFLENLKNSIKMPFENSDKYYN